MEVSKIEKMIEEKEILLPRMNEGFKENLQWFRDNRNKISKYENNWIAVYNNEVTAFSNNPHDVEKQIAAKGIPADEYLLHYLVDSNCIF